MDGQFWQVPALPAGKGGRVGSVAAVLQRVASDWAAGGGTADTGALHTLAALFCEKAARAPPLEAATAWHAAARALELLRSACLGTDRALDADALAPAGAPALLVLLAAAALNTRRASAGSSDLTLGAQCLRLAAAHAALTVSATATDVRAAAAAGAAYWQSRAALSHLLPTERAHADAGADAHTLHVCRLALRLLRPAPDDGRVQALLAQHVAAAEARLAAAQQLGARHRLARGDRTPLPTAEGGSALVLAADATAASAAPALSLVPQRRLDEEIALAADALLALAGRADAPPLQVEAASRLLEEHAVALLGAPLATLTVQYRSGWQLRRVVLVALRAALGERQRWLSARYAVDADSAALRTTLAALDVELRQPWDAAR